MALPIRFCSSCSIWVASALTTGSVPVLIRAPLSSMAARRLMRTWATLAARSTGWKPLPRLPKALLVGAAACGLDEATPSTPRIAARPNGNWTWR